MIDVLSDMTQFAGENALPETREALKATLAVARREVVSPDQPYPGTSMSTSGRA